ncbi:MAG: 8-oxo-dGTP diphosphatase [Dehalococcoidia bacterium]
MPTTGALCYIRDDGRVLLQMKAEGRFGGGLWNGPGGKLHDGETPESAAVREVREETGLAIHDLRDHGTLTFYLGDKREPDYTVHVFSTSSFDGELHASDEGQLEWHSEAALPYDGMWPDDRVWVPHMLAGRRVRGVFRLSQDLKTLLSHELEVLPQNAVARG